MHVFPFLNRRGLGTLLWFWVSMLCCVAADQNWPVYLGDNSSSHFSLLRQINTRNVQRLKPAWTYHSGDGRSEGRSQIQCSPLIIDGILYGTTPQLKLIAVDATNGRELWRFDPFADRPNSSVGVNRGVVYWADRDGKDARIIFGAASFLYAIDARTGKQITNFGKDGRIHLRDDLGRDAGNDFILSNTPGIVFKDLLIVGTRVGEGPAPAAPGHIRAYNIRTGKLAWIFHTIPWPGEFGYDTWPPDAWKTSGAANCWTGMALDEKRGWVFIPTGSTAFDFWGGDRLGKDLFSNCLLAIDATTGKRIWHFQFVHHDLWDRDLPAPPNLLTIKHRGRNVDAVAQVTKSGHVFVFNRETGEPLFPIEERPVPPSDLQGESAWPTQPLPLWPAPFARQLFTEDLITDISKESHDAMLAQYRKTRGHQVFLPPSREGSIVFPGFDGGAEWGGAAIDPRSGVLFVNANEMPWILTMVESRSRNGAPLSSGEQIFRQICAACHGINRQGDPARAFPSLIGVEKKMKKADVLTLLQNGRGVMPSVAFLTDAQKEAVAAFVLGENASVGTENRTASEGDAIGRSPYTHTGYNRFLDRNGYPAVKPPWGTLNAINLNSGKLEWKVPLGELPELTAKGIPPTGTENYGGPVVTAGGLVFIGASKDEMFRAFDSKTGKTLWQSQLPAAGYATPATYSVRGKQYVVIACGGGKSGTKSGDAYVAFALAE